VYEAILARDPAARLILCPRHSERVPEVEHLLRSRGRACERLSGIVPGGPSSRRLQECVVLIDTAGELARIYAVASLVFVGGSLTKRGGQNMMEPAGLGKAVVVGPNTWNFRDPVELLLSHGGLRQAPDAASVREELLSLHADPAARDALGKRARAVCLESKGATRRILDILRDHLPGPDGPARAGIDGPVRKRA
jgi:3-deoxy-D-manno-octulosonic-acid transferase